MHINKQTLDSMKKTRSKVIFNVFYFDDLIDRTLDSFSNQFLNYSDKNPLNLSPILLLFNFSRELQEHTITEFVV